MILKYLFNLLLAIWVYHTFLRPWLERYFPRPTEHHHHYPPSPPAPPPPQNNNGEYIDYEEVKE